MTNGEKLLDLAEEYRCAKMNREDWQPVYGGQPAGREPADIAAEYVETLRSLLREEPSR